MTTHVHDFVKRGTGGGGARGSIILLAGGAPGVASPTGQERIAKGEHMKGAVTEPSASERRTVDAGTIAEAFRNTAAERAGDVAIRTRGDEFTITWGALRERVDALAGGLHRLGLRRGETIALMLSNRPEFHICDLAAMTLGAAPFSIYNTYAPNQIAYVVADADAHILICEQAYLPQVLEARAELPNLEHVIVVDGEPRAGTLALSQVEGSNPGFHADEHIARITPEDVLTLIYTSGTTGPPKGVQLVHRNLLAALEGIDELIQFPRDGRVVSWLPAAHVAERNAHHYIPVVFGLQITCCSDPRQVLSYLPEVKPSWFFAVPRIWEKLKAGLEAMVAAQPEEQQQKLRAALDAALRKVRLEQAGEQVPAELAEEVARADAEIFAGLRTMLGLDEALAINVGAAPTPVEVLEFFHAIGLPLAELWGMSETCGAGSVNPPEKIKLGTVGPPAPGVQIKLDSDGEVLVKSDVVMLGYRNLPEQTAQAFTEDGWLRTGDIGEFDEDGYLKIVDRKKEIIINAAGKNMSPANIEAAVKSASPLISQACCIGDARPYNTALIVLDPDFAPVWAAQQGIEDSSFAALATHPKLIAAVQQAVDTANSKLAKVEQIKKFTILDRDWLPGGEELTPTMKLRRKPIAERYAEVIEVMYAS
jgi:long-subunit acyl-CoA synthetase (AMP-forming)